MKKKLKDRGHYKESEWGMSTINDDGMFEGIRNFQKENGLKVDSIMKIQGSCEKLIEDKYHYFLITCLVSILFYLWLLIVRKYFTFMIMRVLIALLVLFFPYEKYGDFEKLRLISFCEGDGKLCKEGIYPYITKQWRLSSGYVFDDKSRFCKMKI